MEVNFLCPNVSVILFQESLYRNHGMLQIGCEARKLVYKAHPRSQICSVFGARKVPNRLHFLRIRLPTSFVDDKTCKLNRVSVLKLTSRKGNSPFLALLEDAYDPFQQNFIVWSANQDVIDQFL